MEMRSTCNLVNVQMMHRIYTMIDAQMLHYALCRNEVKRRKEFDGRNYELFYMTATLSSSSCHVSG